MFRALAGAIGGYGEGRAIGCPIPKRMRHERHVGCSTWRQPLEASAEAGKQRGVASQLLQGCIADTNVALQAPEGHACTYDCSTVAPVELQSWHLVHASFGHGLQPSAGLLAVFELVVVGDLYAGLDVISVNRAYQPDQQPVTDITEIKSPQGKPYLCIVLDLNDQRIVGWSMEARQDRQRVIRAVQMAVWQRQGSDHVILYSDRGSQFRSGYYQEHLAASGLICSMSAAGHCGDNAACESFLDC